MATLNKLHVFFYNTDNTEARKLMMYNAIIRSKLMYGLETLVMNESVQRRLETFHLKGLRNILQLPTTYINKEFSNDYVRQQINTYLNAHKKKPMLTLTEYHKRRRTAYLAALIAAGDSDPSAAVTFEIDTLKPIDHGKLHVGQPRVNWYKMTLQDLWEETKQNITDVRGAAAFIPGNQRHLKAICEYTASKAEKSK